MNEIRYSANTLRIENHGMIKVIVLTERKKNFITGGNNRNIGGTTTNTDATPQNTNIV